MIWLVDATTYSKEIDSELLRLKREYFIIKNFVKKNILGEYVPAKRRTFSYGLLRIATILDFNGIEIEYFDISELAHRIDIAKTLPDKIAFSAVCPTIPLCQSHSEKIKKKYPKLKTILGGPQVNIAPNKTRIKYPGFDLYSVGSDLDAAQQIAENRLNNPNSGFIKFSLLPYPINDYAINTCTTLGCPFGCKYCQDNRMKYLEVSTDGFISEFIKVVPPRTCIHFFDSVLGGYHSRTLEVCKHIEKTNHRFLLSCDIRAEYIDKDTVIALSKAGFAEVRMGIESADESLLRQNNRTLTPDQLLKAIDIIRKYSSIYITLYSVVGLPGATKESFEKTLVFFSYLLENRMVDEIKSCIYVPYPFDEPMFNSDEIEITSFEWENYDRQSYPNYRLPSLSQEEIWNQYLLLSRAINKNWLKGFGFSHVNQLPQIIYDEYVTNNYHIKTKEVAEKTCCLIKKDYYHFA